jgi:hypothetical protein
MFGLLQKNMDPQFYNGILMILLGPDLSGDPVNGALNDPKNPNSGRGGYVGRVKLINNDKTTTWRELRPGDTVMGGTAGNYSTTLTHGVVSTQICGTVSHTTISVPTGQAVLIIGWYCDGNLSPSGNLQIWVNNILRNELAADVPFNTLEKWVLTPDQITFAVQNDILLIEALNTGAADVVADVYPIGALIGPAAQLGLEAAQGA